MIRNLMKLGVLATVTGFSLNFASQTINEMVIAVHKREKTIADAIIKQQVQEMLKEAEKEIEKVQEETQIEIKQEEVAIKPPLPEKPKKDKPKEEKVEEKVEQVEVAEVQDEMIIEESEQTEVTVDGAATDANLDMTTYYALTKEDITYIGEYLVDHYFLFGYEYYQAETDPVRYARKKLASDMEDHVIGSIGDSFTLLRDMKSLNSATLTPLAENAHLLATQFKETYKDVASQGEEFARIYESVNSFMDTYLDTLNKAEETFKMLEETTNKALVLPMLLKSMNQDLLPSVKDVLNEGFALKEQTNKIYIEGLEADFLITPEEVMDIIENPYSVLPNKVPPTTPNEPNTVVLEEEIQPPVTTTSKSAESDVLKESEVGHATHEEATNLQSEETLESEGN
ncbi:MAG: hypothetical protein ACLSH8_03855 [Zhenhengia sp.]|jgi:hypothetical protein|uniref:hypothetical protein n=1 Tax=Zhenhengia sp. TaxID=2944208 RepID=UPI00290E43D8|nr:hypothetical protein [Clostridiales bacterium]MDU6973563.1 hypothetical protein [Clostridiales bacterium]